MTRRVGRLILALVLVAATVVVAPRAVRLGVGIHEASSLPEYLANCGRDYRKDETDHLWTWAQLSSGIRPGFEPTLVDPGIVAQLLTECHPQTDWPSGCDTVVWVRVDWDAYIDYALQGGC